MRPECRLGERPTLGMMRRELLELVRREGELLAGCKVCLSKIDGHIDGMTSGLCSVERHIDSIDRNIDRLRRDLPGIVRKAVRDAFREERDRRR